MLKNKNLNPFYEDEIVNDNIFRFVEINNLKDKIEINGIPIINIIPLIINIFQLYNLNYKRDYYYLLNNSEFEHREDIPHYSNLDMISLIGNSIDLDNVTPDYVRRNNLYSITKPYILKEIANRLMNANSSFIMYGDDINIWPKRNNSLLVEFTDANNAEIKKIKCYLKNDEAKTIILGIVKYLQTYDFTLETFNMQTLLDEIQSTINGLSKISTRTRKKNRQIIV